jgi:drug/metabolite transporter (DMT)-like permease
LLALLAAVLFGASTPGAKLLLGQVEPQWLAGLLYLGSGVGLGAWALLRRAFDPGKPQKAPFAKADLPWPGGAILAGGVVAPVLLMFGLRGTPASSASLLLNLEGVFTAALAWFAFRENVDRRIFAGVAAILAGGALLSWVGRPSGGIPWAALAAAGACLGWALDDNLTRKVSAADPVQIAGLKGLIAGAVNVGIALAVSPSRPALPAVVAAGALGLLSYGVSLVCFVLALRQLGAARTGAHFSTAPFLAAALSLAVVREAPTRSAFGAPQC